MEAITNIKQRIKAPQSQQKSYVDMWRRLLEFKVRDQVFLKVAPLRGIMKFGRKMKFSPSSWSI